MQKALVGGIITNKQPLLGIGLYTFAEAARLLHIPTGKLRRWAQGYPYAAADKETAEPSLQRDLLIQDGAPILTLADMLELHMISLFRSEGISLQTIRAAARKAAHLFHVDHPFVVRQFETDGKHVFATLQEEGVSGVSPQQMVADLNVSQMVIGSIARPFFRKIDYQDVEPVRYWPMGREGHIVLDAQRAFGKPIDAKSGVPTVALYEMARGGETLEGVAAWYNVDVEAVDAAVSFEHSLRAA